MPSRTSISSPSARNRTATSSKGAKKGRAGSIDVDSDREGFLSPYFREMAVHDVMSRDEEREAAIRIATLRRSYWESILSYPSFIPGILGLVEETLGSGNSKKKAQPATGTEDQPHDRYALPMSRSSTQ